MISHGRDAGTMTHVSLSNDACVNDDGAFAKKAFDPNSFGAGEVVTHASLPVPPEEKKPFDIRCFDSAVAVTRAAAVMIRADGSFDSEQIRVQKDNDACVTATFERKLSV
jgi:hypothetical protein